MVENSNSHEGDGGSSNINTASTIASNTTTSMNMTSKKTESQMTKLKDANAKYKSLLKMAKERIQTQEDELDKLQSDLEKSKRDLASNSDSTQYRTNNNLNNNTNDPNNITTMNEMESIYRSYEYDSTKYDNRLKESAAVALSMDNCSLSCSIVRVCQRIRMDHDTTADVTNAGVGIGSGGSYEDLESMENNSPNHRMNGNNSTHSYNSTSGHSNGTTNGKEEPDYEIWAFIEYEIIDADLIAPIEDSQSSSNNNNANQTSSTNSTKQNNNRFLRWRNFKTEQHLLDHIRKDSGEPISLPPYSLTPHQSQRIEEESRQAVSHITEEFRRFRVRAEVARKQSDATVRSLQSSNVESARVQIEGEDLASELEQARTDHEQLVILKNEMMEQEAQWKEAYDAILKENTALRSSGSEALLAAQWRQRYETTLGEKENLEMMLDMERGKVEKVLNGRKKEDAGKYESKYKDLKESFRLYRKKAKEIFEAQQRGDVAMLGLGDTGSEDAKLSYLKNLMVNYLTSDPAVREHMEGAIGTVLKFSTEDFAKISERKSSYESWFT